jgi:radical SAM-linked protein
MVEQKIKIKFAKTGVMRFISHLDLMRLFQRAARRAEIPVTITKGFNPHPRISIQPALKLGLESSDLEAVFKLDEWMRPDEVRLKLQEKLPPEIEISEVNII